METQIKATIDVLKTPIEKRDYKDVKKLIALTAHIEFFNKLDK
jgi:hypothetical protein